MKKKSIISFSIMFIVYFLLIPRAYACCGCCACDPCVTAALAATKATVKASYEALEASISALEKTFSSGQSSLKEMKKTQSENIVDAIKGLGSTAEMANKKSLTAEASLLSAYANSKETQNKSEFMAVQAFKVANTYGFDNVPRSSKMLHTLQNYELTPPEDADQETSTLLSFENMRSIAKAREVQMFSRIFPELNQTDFDKSSIINAAKSIDINLYLTRPVLQEESIPLYLDSLRMMFVPLNLETMISASEIREGDKLGRQNLIERVKVVASYFAWDASLRSQLRNHDGEWSFMQFVAEIVRENYENLNGITDEVNSGERELLQGIAINQSVNNMLDDLILEAMRHGHALDVTLAGYQADASNAKQSVSDVDRLDIRVKD